MGSEVIVELQRNATNWANVVGEIVKIERKIFPKHEPLARSFDEELRKKNPGLLYIELNGEVAGYVMYSWPSSLCASITKLAAATTTFCHQELETSENFRTQTDQASEALAFNVKPGKPNGKLLTSWNPAYSKADYVVAQDGSGTHKTINDALDALVRTGGDRRNRRVIVYVKAGEYNERVVIKKNMEKLMFVGDGMDRTIVTGNRNAKRDGFAPHETATFGVYADGFWARDMTFENTAGPDGHQVVALMMRSEQSVVYRCSVKGYQNTLYVQSKRQFYRDCHIYGTVDFIFGNAAVVLQNCDIFV
ncbi:hypothetical protein DKX38_022397 [Salix brachista]|uniref:Pectinesterase n=1 Tax=Salix brachista TaxID=2182728 RepID=A0A5N5JZK9_9ROSI|nr:hypothetical protein DKX38_022397 [Salix brachista]